ncbi:hypothetical protein RUM44_008111 [Polyplax serrata]|uniref:Branched-chain-amino-acid aminotransferase n=1 Tax=Polyplax serrata TaxID=468196 RepID=A0ABR1B981_POLSC
MTSLNRGPLKRFLDPQQVLKLNDAKVTNGLVRCAKTFRFSDLEIQLAGPDQLQPKPNPDELEFGKTFTDHMCKIEFENRVNGWKKPKILPLENISLHPAAKVLHYAIELFEGMKAFRGVDDRIRLFRPDLNMIRMNLSAERSGLPNFDTHEMIKILARLVQIEQEWVPHKKHGSLYIRPTLIGTDPVLGVVASDAALMFTICSPVKSYFSNDFRASSLLADPQYTRAWPGGCGDRKMGCNYGPTVEIQRQAISMGLQSVLWLYGEDNQITEAGTMNVFFVIKGEDGKKELVTPPLNGLILPGVFRRSVLDLARQYKRTRVIERQINMQELIDLVHQERCLEMFGVGTASFLMPISSVLFKGVSYQIPTVEPGDKEYLFYYQTLSEIMYGEVEHPWGVCIDDYSKNET